MGSIAVHGTHGMYELVLEFGTYAQFTLSESEHEFFSLTIDITQCEQLHRKQCNLFVSDVAFAFAWCERTLIDTNSGIPLQCGASVW